MILLALLLPLLQAPASGQPVTIVLDGTEILQPCTFDGVHFIYTGGSLHIVHPTFIDCTFDFRIPSGGRLTELNEMAKGKLDMIWFKN